MKRVLALLLVSGTLAGCITDEVASPGPAALIERTTAGLPPLQWDVKTDVDWWEDIATNYPKHDSNLPTNTMLRERLVDDLRALGLDVEVRQYAGVLQGQQLPEAPGTELYAIVATKVGTTMPDHRIGLVSHYDTQTLTIHGAYDDASGVAADYSICKALAQVRMERTLACIFFDGEERGLAASQAYVQDVVLDGDEGYVYDFVLGYDMTGINWPGHSWKLYAMAGAVWDRPVDPDPEVSPLYPFAQDLLNGAFGYPPEGLEVLPDSHRNSDERRFKEAGVPIIRFAGGLNATDYDQYHMPLDTVDHVYEVTAGRANFEAGFAAVVEAGYSTALALDRTSFAEIAAVYG
ncbi:MAG: M28 family peptidase [Candidatus Thermoplasmatota archaeon]|jgi:hypothetical protein